MLHTCHPGTGDAEDQEFKVISDHIENLRPPWDTQAPVSERDQKKTTFGWTTREWRAEPVPLASGPQADPAPPRPLTCIFVLQSLQHCHYLGHGCVRPGKIQPLSAVSLLNFRPSFQKWPSRLVCINQFVFRQTCMVLCRYFVLF